MGRACVAMAGARAGGRRAELERGLPDLPDSGRSMAARVRAAGGLRGEGAARGEAEHQLGEAGRGVRARRAGLVPGPVLEPRVPGRAGALRGAGGDRRRTLRARSNVAEADRPRSARRVPGRRAVGTVAGGPGQPAPGRLGAPPRGPGGAARRCRADPRDDQAVPDPPRAGAARAREAAAARRRAASRRGAAASPTILAATAIRSSSEGIELDFPASASGRWRNVLTGAELDLVARVALERISFGDWPVALLERLDQ